MCDREHFDTLRDRVERLEDDVKVYHARTDERLKTLFQTCEKLSSTAATLLRAAHGTTAMPGDNMFASYHRIGDSVHVGGVDGFDARVVEVRFSIGCSPRYVLHRVDPGEHDVMETILSREEISIHDQDGGGAE